MKLLATIKLDQGDLEEVLNDYLSRTGYKLSGDIEWSTDEEGVVSVLLEVLPLTDAEREAQGLPKKLNANDVVEGLEYLESVIEEKAEELTALIQKIPLNVASASSTPRDEDESDAPRVLITEEDYTEAQESEEDWSDLSPDERASRARVAKLRREQTAVKGMAPNFDHYNEDEDGFIRIGE